MSNYWQLGLLHLLAGDWETAQSVWLMGLLQLDSDAPPAELLALLQAEAERQFRPAPT